MAANPSISRAAVAYSQVVGLCLGRERAHRIDRLPTSKKPVNILYDVEESPPIAISLVMALQHAFVLSVGWIFVVVLITGIGGTTEQAAAIIRISMIVSGVATILQARTAGPIGSGYLCPLSCGPAYLSAAVLAGKVGGLPLVFGMTTLFGVFETLLSRLMRRLRGLFPPEVTGLVVAMVGIQLIGMGCTRFTGFNGHSADPRSALVAFVTLLAMVAPTISKTRLRLYPVLLGLAAGYAAALTLGLLTIAQLHSVLSMPWLGLPSRVPGGGWSIQLALLAPFLIASLSSTLKTVGDITLCQKINDSEWKRTDMKSVSGGILAGSICTAAAGLVGGIGQTTFSSNVGLSIATGVTSRAVAVPTGILLVALAFFPKLAAFFAVIPAPVTGAVLVYVACFMILGGLQVLTSRMLDVRRTFVVGISLVFGLSVEMVPGLYAQLPTAVRPLFASALSLTTVLAVVLNGLLRVGIARTRGETLSPTSDDFDSISRLMEEQGAEWGMRKEVCSQVIDALHEFLVALRAQGITSSVSLRLRFDEVKLTAVLEYQGAMISIPKTPPTAEALASGTASISDLSGYVLRQYADNVRVRPIAGGCRVFLHFEH